MGNWTHAICTMCWVERNPDRDPHQLVNAKAETCCFCGMNTTAGIYVRADPNALKFCRCGEETR